MEEQFPTIFGIFGHFLISAAIPDGCSIAHWEGRMILFLQIFISISLHRAYPSHWKGANFQRYSPIFRNN